METCRHSPYPLSKPCEYIWQVCLQVRRIPEAIHGSALLFVRLPRTLSVCMLESILLFTIIELLFTTENQIHNPLLL